MVASILDLGYYRCRLVEVLLLMVLYYHLFIDSRGWVLVGKLSQVRQVHSYDTH
jgi:hypothetical protein